MGEPTQATNLGHGPRELCGGLPGQLYLSLLVCREDGVGLREADSPARVVLPSLGSQTLLSLQINLSPFRPDQSELGVMSLSGL